MQGLTSAMPGQPCLWALKNIALHWNRFSTSEARGWAATLPGA